jgi:hypothetical protein
VHSGRFGRLSATLLPVGDQSSVTASGRLVSQACIYHLSKMIVSRTRLDGRCMMSGGELLPPGNGDQEQAFPPDAPNSLRVAGVLSGEETRYDPR